LAPDDTVLDFGAGTGLLTAHVTPRVGRVVALDVSPAMLRELTAKPEFQGRVTTRCQDILQQPLNETFTRIVSAMAMHHVQDTARLMHALWSHLDPGGRIALADLDREAGDFHPPDVEGVFHHGFERDALATTIAAAGFVHLTFDTACVVSRNGKSYPVFLVTAQRP
jgi:cyclopropane fatty-acyl-phospholipid synthase-like methyltransferase